MPEPSLASFASAPHSVLENQRELEFLRRCYVFVNQDWQHAHREALPDQGFEMRFRESCVTRLLNWSISMQWELQLGEGLDTASGVAHEIDIVARCDVLRAVLEIKNRPNTPPEKNDIIIFFAKLLDYLSLNPRLLDKGVCPVFLSNGSFAVSGLAACLGLGIHPVGPGLRPLPMLLDNLERMTVELRQGLVLPPNERADFDDFRARLSVLEVALGETWLSNRCGCMADDRMVMRAVGPLPTHALSQELRELNGECTSLLEAFKKAKSAV